MTDTAPTEIQRMEVWQVLAVCPQSVEHEGEQAWYQTFKLPMGVDRDGAFDFVQAAKLEFPVEGSPCPVHGNTRFRWALRKLVTTVEDFEDDV